jgi:hypothetical protein
MFIECGAPAAPMEVKPKFKRPQHGGKVGPSFIGCHGDSGRHPGATMKRRRRSTRKRNRQRIQHMQGG